MDKELLETFLAIVDSKTISGAAEMLCVSQSTVSHRLNTLEIYLGCSLFERQRGIKNVRLTPAGSRFISLARQMLELDETIKSMRYDSSKYQVHIAGMDSVNQYLLARILSQMHILEPALQMTLYTFHSKEIYRKLDSREFDIGFAYLPVHYSEIVATPVFREPIMMISAPDSVYTNAVIHPSELDKSDEVLYSWESRLVQWHNEWWPQYKAPYIKVDSCGLLQNFFLTNRAWAMCPASVASELYSMGMVKKHSFAMSPPDRICYMLTRKGAASSNTGIKLFVEAFNKILERHPCKYYEDETDEDSAAE